MIGLIVVRVEVEVRVNDQVTEEKNEECRHDYGPWTQTWFRLASPSYGRKAPFAGAPKHLRGAQARAYELYEQRGRKDGHDLDDWLASESEVRQNSQAAAA